MGGVGGHAAARQALGIVADGVRVGKALSRGHIACLARLAAACVSSQGVCSLNCFLDFQFEILDEILLL